MSQIKIAVSIVDDNKKLTQFTTGSFKIASDMKQHEIEELHRWWMAGNFGSYEGRVRLLEELKRSFLRGDT